LRRYFLQAQDIDDLVQDVLGVVIRKLPQFQHQGRKGAFRTWLRNTAVNQLRVFWRSKHYRPAVGDPEFLRAIEKLEDSSSELSCLWDREHDRHLSERLLEAIAPEFAPKTWQAFRRVVLDGEKASIVAVELGLSTNAVYIAKTRVLSRLRQEGDGLIS
jgi:RNA polymerase sigma-70 factor (ECF subfamily)